MLSRLLLLGFLGAGLLCACDNTSNKTSSEPTASASSALAWDNASFMSHRDDATTWRFPIPTAGWHVDSHRYDDTLPATKIRRSAVISEGSLPVLQIDAWDNPDSLELVSWLEATQRIYIEDSTGIQPAQVGSTRQQAVMLETPRSPQARGRKLVFFASGSRIIRLACFDTEDFRAMAIYQRIVDSFDAGENR